MIELNKKLSSEYDALKIQAESVFNHGKYEEAFHLYHKLITNVGYFPELLDKITWCALYTPIYEPLIQLIELRPTDVKLPTIILSRLGFIYYKLLKYKEAQELIEASLLIEKKQPVALLTLSEIMLEMGNIEAAYEVINSSLLLNNSDNARKHLSKILALAEDCKFQGNGCIGNSYLPEVAFGHNENVFLLGGAHNIKNYVCGDLIPKEQSIRHFYNNIISRAEYCQKRRIQYAHIIFSDKHSILRRDFLYKQNSPLADYYLEKNNYFITSDTTLPIVYPLNELIERNELGGMSNAVTIKGDSHLSDVGYLVVVQQLLRFIEPKKEGEYMAYLLDHNKSTFKATRWSGDIALKFNPPPTSTRFVYKHICDSHFISNGVFSNDGLVNVWLNEAALSNKKILIFGDSYFKFVGRFLSLLYSNVIFCRTRFMHREVIEEISPDIVLTGNAERYLSYVASDVKMKSFNKYYSNMVNESEYEVFSEKLSAKYYSSLLKL
jgi:tetratricopeptide (TPR) repeat protein